MTTEYILFEVPDDKILREVGCFIDKNTDTILYLLGSEDKIRRLSTREFIMRFNKEIVLDMLNQPAWRILDLDSCIEKIRMTTSGF